MGLLAGPGNPLVRDSFLISLAYWAYPSGSGGAFLDGSLKLRYCTFPFARKKPTLEASRGWTCSRGHCEFRGF